MQCKFLNSWNSYADVKFRYVYYINYKTSKIYINSVSECDG